MSGEKLGACIKNPKYTKVTGSFCTLYFIRIMKITSKDFQKLVISERLNS